MSEPLRILLEDYGFGLSDVATGTGCPQGTLRALKSGRLAEKLPNAAQNVENSLWELVRVCTRLQRAGSDQPATLLTNPLVDGYTTVGWHALHAGCEVALFDLAAGRDPQAVLDHYLPSWREHYWTDYEVFSAADGHPAIRLKRDAHVEDPI